MLKIGILLGDDIGLEVVPEAVKVMKAAAAKAGLEVDWRPLPIGKKAHETHGTTMPQSTVEALKSVDGYQVKVGDVVARPPDGKLGAVIHASIAGRVSVAKDAIVIEA